MKIYYCNLQDYEKEILEQIKAEYPEHEIISTEKSFDIKDLDKLAGFDGISIHGLSRVDYHGLSKMKELGIMHLSTRTIGYDHIGA